MLKDPDTLLPRYIGVTSVSLSARLSHHKWESRKLPGTHKRNWIKSLLKVGKIPIIQLIEECSEDNWEEREMYWIRYYSNLTNNHIGGAGVIRDRKSDSIQRSAQSKYIEVLQIDSDGNIINEFPSIKHATEYMGFKSMSSVTNALKNSGKSVRAGGYYWAYKDNFTGINSIKNLVPKRKVGELGENNNIIREFESIKDAANYYNVNKSMISMVCNGIRKTCKNKKLIYIE